MHVALVHHHVGGRAGGGGGVRLMLELGAALTEMGHRVTVVCHDYLAGGEFAPLADRLEIRAVRTGVSEWPATRPGLVRRFWLEMPRVARLVPPDVDVVNAHEWPGSHAGALASRRLRVPFVWTRNDETGWERAITPEHTIIGDPRVSRRGLRAALGWPDLLDARRADAIVVLAERQAEMVRRSYRRPALRLPLGPSRQFFEPPPRDEARRLLGVPPDDFLVMSMAILFPHRRFEDLIEAMALLGDALDVRALILGSDHGDRAYADRLSELVARRGVGDRVELPRRDVPEEVLRAAYAAADLFVWPAQRQTWGLAPLEALASGTPVVVSRGAGVHEILEGRPGVQVVAPERPDLLAAAIRRARTLEAHEGVEATREWLRVEHDIGRYAGRMAAVYDDVVARESSLRTAS